MFDFLRKKILGVREEIKDVGSFSKEIEKITVKDRAGAFLRGEVILDEKKLDEVFSKFELMLVESDVAVEVSERITEDLKNAMYGKKLKREDLNGLIAGSLKKSLLEILPTTPDLISLVESKVGKPYVIVFVGVNGTGKTTTIAKVARLLQKHNLTCVIAASDTFRAGAIEQLEKHAEKLGVRLVKHAKGADSAAVAYDAVEHAKAHGKDAVLVDTAGRAETNVNLIDEMKKIVRVTKPDAVLFVGDALTGNAAVEQAEKFGSAVSLTGTILTKADADAKGGAAISIAHVTKKPILFLGTGQGHDDLLKFDAEWFVGEILA